MTEASDRAPGAPLPVVLAALERIAPLGLAADWDNVGLLVEPPALSSADPRSPPGTASAWNCQTAAWRGKALVEAMARVTSKRGPVGQEAAGRSLGSDSLGNSPWGKGDARSLSVRPNHRSWCGDRRPKIEDSVRTDASRTSCLARRLRLLDRSEPVYRHEC